MPESHSGHRGRLRLKIERYGFDSLYAHEVIEFMLFGAIARRDTNGIARALIEKFGSYEEVFSQPVEELIKVDGMGVAAALQIRSYAYFAKTMRGRKEDEKINSLGEARRYFRSHFFKTVYEEFHTVFLGENGEILQHEIYSSNSKTNVVVPVSSVVEMTTRLKPHFVLFAHNHPSGNAMPSLRDEEFTKNIARIMEQMLGNRAFEHMIFAGANCYSFRNNCILNVDEELERMLEERRMQEQ